MHCIFFSLSRYLGKEINHEPCKLLSSVSKNQVQTYKLMQLYPIEYTFTSLLRFKFCQERSNFSSQCPFLCVHISCPRFEETYIVLHTDFWVQLQYSLSTCSSSSPIPARVINIMQVSPESLEGTCLFHRAHPTAAEIFCFG